MRMTPFGVTAEGSKHRKKDFSAVPQMAEEWNALLNLKEPTGKCHRVRNTAMYLNT